MSASTDDVGARLARGETTLAKAIADELRERDWIAGPCRSCGRPTFTKRRGPQLPCCLGFDACPRPPAPRKRSTPAQLWAQIRRFFDDRSLAIDPPLPVLNPYRDTIFTVAGVQIFQPTLREGRPPPSGLRVVAQPCVRLRYADAVPDPEGISTSFVNLCTEQFDASVADYLRHFDLWMDLCSSIGLHAHYMVLSFASTSRPHLGEAAEIRWSGIELGEGIWNHTVAHGPSAGSAFTDFGFGLDRLVWAAIRSHSYYENIGPTRWYPPRFARTLDQLRTAALLLGSGLQPGPRDAAFQLRKLLRSFAIETPHFDFRAPLQDFLSEWSRFIVLPVAFTECVRIIDQELRRHRIAAHWDRPPVRIAPQPDHSETRQVCS